MAIVLNSPHMIIQPINLFQINADDQRFGVLLLGRCKFILFSGQFFSSFFSFFFWIWLYLNFLVDQFGITCEEFVCQLIVLFFMLIVQSWECFKDHAIILAAPVELFLWELVSFFIAKAKSNIIVCFDSTNSSPE